ncbi:hypothetical protein DJ568_08655 [Mucilaginibacter hurinus]|uniref:Uncharacterized protein n=1 Tax=Mucilaginibacter hurinus TaxID=2201324 RepID=A0A367GQV3_9SPHI|nr:hypothetical protein [Mucilaginibacter hurinus]RCH55246.1 hypothetical protein DJ568_08655 [Mucilaginibacter hurinus]
MKNVNFETINDAYQLVRGAKIKGKKQEEVFELGHYDADKRGYTVYPYEEGMKYTDFSVLVSEKELKNNYLIEAVKSKAIAAGAVENTEVLEEIQRLRSA